MLCNYRSVNSISEDNTVIYVAAIHINISREIPTWQNHTIQFLKLVTILQSYYKCSINGTIRDKCVIICNKKLHVILEAVLTVGRVGSTGRLEKLKMADYCEEKSFLSARTKKAIWHAQELRQILIR